MVTIKQKPIVNTQKIKRKESKHAATKTNKQTSNHKERQEERKEGTKELKNSQEIISKMLKVRLYVSRITLNIN